MPAAGMAGLRVILTHSISDISIPVAEEFLPDGAELSREPRM